MKELWEPEGLFAKEEIPELSSLFANYERLASRHKRFKVNLVSFLSGANPIQLLEERLIPDYSVELEAKEDFHIVRLRREIRRSDIEGGGRTVEGQFGLYGSGKGGIWTAFATGDPDFFERGLLGLLREHRPEITRVFLTSDEIRHLFEEVEKEHNWTVFVRKGVLYSHFEEGQITFEKVHFQTLFDEAETKNRYVDKVEFVIRDNAGNVLLHAFISRDCVFYFLYGRVGLLREVILSRISDIGSHKEALFEKRERRYGEMATKPIEIVFPEDRLLDVADNKRFVDGLSKISGIALSILHLNPYLHVTILDFVDGSNFDLVAISSNRVRIVPSFRSSVFSLMRISDGIFRTFDEATIEEVQPAEYSLEDFIGG